MSVSDSTAPETWRPVVAYPDSYEVSDSGNVRSLPRRVRTGRGATRLVRGHLVRQRSHEQGYRVVALQRGNKSRAFLVHRLVAEAFIGTITESVEVNHKDGDKTNNAVTNLEIVTRQENIDHAVRTGLIDNKGEKNAQAKATADQAREIRALYRPGGNPGYKALGKRFGLSWGTVRNIVKRKTWRHLET